MSRRNRLNRIERQRRLNKRQRAQRRRQQREQLQNNLAVQSDYEYVDQAETFEFSQHHKQDLLEQYGNTSPVVQFEPRWDLNWFRRQVGRDGVFDIKVREETLSDAEKDHVYKTLDHIDEIIGTPIRINDKATGRLDAEIYAIDSFNDHPDVLAWGFNDSNTAGLAHIRNGVTNAMFRSDDVLTTFDKYVISHEILHVFGLYEPNGNGYSKGFDTADTLMSYNPDQTGYTFDITSRDAHALQLAWG